jgi:hypothetical protein
LCWLNQSSHSDWVMCERLKNRIVLLVFRTLRYTHSDELIIIRYLIVSLNSPHLIFHFPCINCFLYTFFIGVEPGFSCFNFYKYYLFDVSLMHTIKHYIIYSFTHKHEVFVMIREVWKYRCHSLSNIPHRDALRLTHSRFSFFAYVSSSE